MDEESQPQPNNDGPEFADSAEAQADLAGLAQTEAVLQAWSAGVASQELASRYGANWPEIENQAKLSRTAQQAGTEFRQAVPAFDKAAMWARISSQLPAAQISATPSADSANPVAETPKLRVLPPISTNNSKSPSRKNIWLNRVSWPARIAAAILIFFVLSAGFATAAQAASPGDFLYGAKVALDRSSEVFAFTPDAKAQAALNFCQHRLQEMQDLVREGRYDLLPDVTSDYLSGLQDVQNATTQLSPNLTQQLDSQRNQFQALQQQATSPTAQNNFNKVISGINQVKASATATATVVTSTPTKIAVPMVTPVGTTLATNNGDSSASNTINTVGTPSPEDVSTSLVVTTEQTVSTSSMGNTPVIGGATSPVADSTDTPASVSTTNSAVPADTTTGVSTNPPSSETTVAPTNTPTVGDDTTAPIVIDTPIPLNTTVPAEPTDAPKPTHTPKPTNTPKPTAQPKPTDTPKPKPTDIPAPPKPTEKPKPTEPPKPTDPPRPTEQPKPTDPPKPTKEPKPTDIPAPPKPTDIPKPPKPTEPPKPTKAPDPPKPTEPPKPTKAPDPPKPPKTTKPPKAVAVVSYVPTKQDGSTNPTPQSTIAFDQLIIWDNKSE